MTKPEPFWNSKDHWSLLAAINGFTLLMADGGTIISIVAFFLLLFCLYNLYWMD